MAELTIQISDELASRLDPLKKRLPQLLEQLLEIAESKAFTFRGEGTPAQTPNSVYKYVKRLLFHQAQ